MTTNVEDYRRLMGPKAMGLTDDEIMAIRTKIRLLAQYAIEEFESEHRGKHGKGKPGGES